jgi:hypothetical protein
MTLMLHFIFHSATQNADVLAESEPEATVRE